MSFKAAVRLYKGRVGSGWYVYTMGAYNAIQSRTEVLQKGVRKWLNCISIAR